MEVNSGLILLIRDSRLKYSNDNWYFGIEGFDVSTVEYIGCVLK